MAQVILLGRGLCCGKALVFIGEREPTRIEGRSKDIQFFRVGPIPTRDQSRSVHVGHHRPVQGVVLPQNIGPLLYHPGQVDDVHKIAPVYPRGDHRELSGRLDLSPTSKSRPPGYIQGCEAVVFLFQPIPEPIQGTRAIAIAPFSQGRSRLPLPEPYLLPYVPDDDIFVPAQPLGQGR